MLRNNIKNIVVVSLLIISSSFFLVFIFSRNQKSTDQSTPSPTAYITRYNNQKQSSPVNLIDCLNEYKSFIQNIKVGERKCQFYKNDIPDLALWEQEYSEYITNVVETKELKLHPAIIDRIDNHHSRNKKNLEFLQTNIITSLTNSSSSNDLRQKLQARLEAIENSLQDIKAIDEFSKDIAVVPSQEVQKPLTRGDLWSIISNIFLVLLIPGAVVFTWLHRGEIKAQELQLSKLKEEINASKNKSIGTNLLEFNVDNQNTDFYSRQINFLSYKFNEIKDLIEKENPSHTDHTDKIASKVASLVSESLKDLIQIQEENNKQLEEISRKLDLQTENKKLKKENDKLSNEINADKKYLKELEDKYTDLVKESKIDKELIRQQSNKISNLESAIENLKNEIGRLEFSYKNSEKTTLSLSPSKEHEEQLATLTNVDLHPQVAEFVNRYNKDPDSLWIYAAKVMTEVSEPGGSYDERRRDNSQPIIFRSLSSDINESEYCIITVATGTGSMYVLFPKNNRITETRYQIICGQNSLFECSGYREDITKKFFMKQPAKVSPRDTGQKEWQLQERGKLEFLEE